MPLERKLVLSKAFEKSYSIGRALLKLQQDAYDPSLKTHKLSGKLALYFACSCGYDCRIIFTIEKDIVNPEAENILLLDIGTHDDVY